MGSFLSLATSSHILKAKEMGKVHAICTVIKCEKYCTCITLGLVFTGTYTVHVMDEATLRKYCFMYMNISRESELNRDFKHDTSFHREIQDQSLNLESSIHIHVFHFRKQPSQSISQVDNLC